MTYTTPGGSYSRLYADMAQQKHLLIAGATGSGKSTAIDGILHAILHGSPADDRLILIDIKKVELIDYHELPHLHSYADDVPSALQALQTAIDIMLARYTDMQRRRIKEYDGSHLYVIIDELADLMTTAPKQAAPMIQRITQLGRGASCHMIAATQCPISAVIPTPIKVNFPAKLGLMTATAQDSRNIIARAGCEKLPYPPDAGEAYGLLSPRPEAGPVPAPPHPRRRTPPDHRPLDPPKRITTTAPHPAARRDFFMPRPAPRQAAPAADRPHQRQAPAQARRPAADPRPQLDHPPKAPRKKPRSTRPEAYFLRPSPAATVTPRRHQPPKNARSAPSAIPRQITSAHSAPVTDPFLRLLRHSPSLSVKPVSTVFPSSK